MYPWLGLDSLTFDTFGWDVESTDGRQRRFAGGWITMIEDFFPYKPRLPSLRVDHLQQYYATMSTSTSIRRGMGTEREGGRRRRIIDLAVSAIGPTPLIRLLLAEPTDNYHGNAFLGSITVPTAECSWLIRVQAREGGGPSENNMTGWRTALALDMARSDNPDLPPEDTLAAFNAFDVRWDGLYPDEPLTVVRSLLGQVEASLRLLPEVLAAPRFVPPDWNWLQRRFPRSS